MEAGALQAAMTFMRSAPAARETAVQASGRVPGTAPGYTLEVHDDPTFFVLPCDSPVPVLVHNNKKGTRAAKLPVRCSL